jgi:hypothetical protein
VWLWTDTLEQKLTGNKYVNVTVMWRDGRDTMITDIHHHNKTQTFYRTLFIVNISSPRYVIQYKLCTSDRILCRWGSAFYEFTIVASWKYKVGKCHSTGDFRYTRVLFQYYAEHQYPIRGQVRSCHACLLSCARNFTASFLHYDSGNYKWRPVMVYHSDNSRVR